MAISLVTNFTAEAVASAAIPYAGIRIGEIIGHRLWWVIEVDHQPWLCSLAHRRLWKPNETVEGDINAVVDPWGYPAIRGGVYAFADSNRMPGQIAELEEKAAWYRNNGGVFYGWCGFAVTSLFVSGTVKMWGDVVEHENGYRAQYAKLNSIDAIHGVGDTSLAYLRKRYGV